MSWLFNTVIGSLVIILSIACIGTQAMNVVNKQVEKGQAIYINDKEYRCKAVSDVK